MPSNNCLIENFASTPKIISPSETLMKDNATRTVKDIGIQKFCVSISEVKNFVVRSKFSFKAISRN